MQRIIHGPNTSHPSIATLLTSLAPFYQEFGQLQKAVVMHVRSLGIKRAIYATTYAVHPEIVFSFHDFSKVHSVLILIQKANHYQEESTEISRVICERMSATGQREHTANNNDEATEMRISCEKGWDDPLANF